MKFLRCLRPLLASACLGGALVACHAQPPDPMQDTERERASHEYLEDPAQLSDEQWRERLTAEEYRVLRQAGTERAGSGALENHEGVGVYRCAACGAELFRSEAKFHSGCGWPAFYDAADNDRVRLIRDTSHGMIRTEVRCARCDSHLGHLFTGEGYPTPLDQRYCINSVCLDFVPAEEAASAPDAPPPAESGPIPESTEEIPADPRAHG